MITKDQAREVAQAYLNDRMTRRPDGPVVVIEDEHTIERDYGWLFVYNTDAFVRTRDRAHALIGASSLLVRKDTAALIEFPSSYDYDEALEAYEADPGRFPIRREGVRSGQGQ